MPKFLPRIRAPHPYEHTNAGAALEPPPRGIPHRQRRARGNGYRAMGCKSLREVEWPGSAFAVGSTNVTA